jgi:hypothetical protein
MSDLQGFTAEQTVEPTYPQYTNLGLGEGTFDQLMIAVKHHLDEQFELNRITGPQYAEVYVQSLQAVMTNSTQYLLGILFADQQKAKIEADTSLTQKQEEKIDADIRLVELEEVKLKYEMEQLYPLRKQELEATIANLGKQGQLIDKQIEKLDADIAHLLAQQSLWLKQEEKLGAEIANLGKQGELIDEQILKIKEEVDLLSAKIQTERANTESGVGDPGSLIGRQRSLLSAQKLAFSGDIRSKMAKLHADYAAVFQSVQEVPEDAALNSDAKTAISSANVVANSIESA